MVASVPLLIGGVVYVLWRAPSLLMFEWFDYLGLAPLIGLLRAALSGVGNQLPGWILYSWPDAAWAMSGVMIFACIWRGSQSHARHAWIFLAPSLAIGSELAQCLGLLPGTFDPADLISCCLARLAAVVAASRFFASEF